MHTENDWSGVTPADALNLAIERAGSQGKLADICGCTQGAIWQMTKLTEPQLSPKFVIPVSRALRIPPWVLRPDIYPPDLEAGPEASAKVA